jgi:hypothetical protein
MFPGGTGGEGGWAGVRGQGGSGGDGEGPTLNYEIKTESLTVNNNLYVHPVGSVVSLHLILPVGASIQSLHHGRETSKR